MQVGFKSCSSLGLLVGSSLPTPHAVSSCITWPLFWNFGSVGDARLPSDLAVTSVRMYAQESGAMGKHDYVRGI